MSWIIAFVIASAIFIVALYFSKWLEKKNYEKQYALLLRKGELIKSEQRKSAQREREDMQEYETESTSKPAENTT